MRRVPYPAGSGALSGFFVCVTINKHTNTDMRRNSLVVLQCILLIPCAQPLHAPGAAVLTCSSCLFGARPHAASHPLLFSQPENGYMCKWQDKKAHF